MRFDFGRYKMTLQVGKDDAIPKPINEVLLDFLFRLECLVIIKPKEGSRKEFWLSNAGSSAFDAETSSSYAFI